MVIMNNKELEGSLSQYSTQLTLVKEALRVCTDDNEKKSLLTLQNDINQLIHLTRESLDTVTGQDTAPQTESNNKKPHIDDEYALFMEEMAKSGAYKTNSENSKGETSKQTEATSDDSDIEDELATLPGIKCAVYHTHRWGGQPTLHNAMVSTVLPRQDNDKFKDLQVRVLFTHPTHSEMLPCPFYLDGECRFDDEQCRYSHGKIVQLSTLQEAIEPDFESVKVGSRVLVKLNPPDSEDITLKKKSTEKYHLWHRSVVKSIDAVKRFCIIKLESGVKSGEKRKSASDEVTAAFENIFPLNNDAVSTSNSEDSLSDTEYPEVKASKPSTEDMNRALVVEKSLLSSGPAIGEWERHTRGIGSKLMFAMGYVAGTGLGASSDGRVQPVEARAMPAGKSLDHCMAISEKMAIRDPLKVEQKLKRLQKKEEEGRRRAYELVKEREKRNVFNFLNRTIGDKCKEGNSSTETATSIKQSSNDDLNIEQFKLTEETRKIEKDIIRLNSALGRQVKGTTAYSNVKMQILEKNRELDAAKSRVQQITKEQTLRKNKQKMTVF